MKRRSIRINSAVHAETLIDSEVARDVLAHSLHGACAPGDFPYTGILAYAGFTPHLRDGGFVLRGSS